MRNIFVLAVALGFALPVAADDRLAAFQGGIGSQPLRAGALTNDVNGVQPGGRPWVISDLRADIRTDGRIRVDGRGLLLAGGNNVGRPGIQDVHARLFCGTVPHNSPAVRVEANGDFRIEGELTPLPPTDCATPVLLIVSAGGNWFAAGIPKE